jgi:hypothetical protein
MVLQDHFGPPLGMRRHWHAFPNAWATYIASDLNGRLPEGYFAEPNVQFGIEIDVAAFEEAEGFHAMPSVWPDGTAAGGWSAPAPTQTIPLPILTDVVEVLVYGREGGPTLAGAIELISPANKDRPEHRDAFVTKCAAYLQQGLGLVVVDVVTGRRADLHRDLLGRLGASPLSPFPAASALQAGGPYAASYRPIERDGQPSLDIWHESLSIGGPLPGLPLWLRGALCLHIDLDGTYNRTCREGRIPVGG